MHLYGQIYFNLIADRAKRQTGNNAPNTDTDGPSLADGARYAGTNVTSGYVYGRFRGRDIILLHALSASTGVAELYVAHELRQWHERSANGARHPTDDTAFTSEPHPDREPRARAGQSDPLLANHRPRAGHYAPDKLRR